MQFILVRQCSIAVGSLSSHWQGVVCLVQSLYSHGVGVCVAFTVLSSCGLGDDLDLMIDPYV